MLLKLTEVRTVEIEESANSDLSVGQIIDDILADSFKSDVQVTNIELEINVDDLRRSASKLAHRSH